MSAPRRARLLRRVLPAAAVALLLAGCGHGAVEVAAPRPPAAARAACERLYERLPDRLDEQPRRETTSASKLVAAWGSPAIVLRCGVGRPRGLQPTSQLFTVNGVDWLPEPADRPQRFTTVGRTAHVEVTVPQEYAPAAGVLVGLAAPVKAAIPPSS